MRAKLFKKKLSDEKYEKLIEIKNKKNCYYKRKYFFGIAFVILKNIFNFHKICFYTFKTMFKIILKRLFQKNI